MGANVKLADYKGATPLHHAVTRSSSSTDTLFVMERLLLDNGAEINAKDKNLRTPLHYAFVGAEDSYARPRNIDPVETVTSLLGYPDCDHLARGFKQNCPCVLIFIPSR